MSAVGPLLSEYRKRNHLSQLELSLLADVSSRHISFIETGKTRPSREMLIKLADVLNLPHKDSNLLLNSGGYTAAYSALDLNQAEMEPIRNALALMLDNHNPYPALVMDGNYNIIMANQAQQQLTRVVTGGKENLPSSNVLELVFRMDGFRPYLANWDEIASHLLRRLRKQVIAYSKPDQEALYQRLLELSPPANWQQPQDSIADGPMLTVDFNLGGEVLSSFSTLSQFGTALDIGMEELMIESYFPANSKSEAFFRRFAG